MTDTTPMTRITGPAITASAIPAPAAITSAATTPTHICLAVICP